VKGPYYKIIVIWNDLPADVTRGGVTSSIMGGTK